MRKNFAIIGVAFISAFVFAEVLLRYYYKPLVKTYPCVEQGHPAYSTKQCPTSQDRLNSMRFSGDLLYTPQASSAGKGWSTDSYGFRNNGSLEIMPKQGVTFKEVRIAVTGGSTAWGVGVMDGQTIPAVLQKNLAKRCQGIDIVVWNAAISAQTSGQERRHFETDILPLRPDIHIAFSGFNDIYNSYTGLLPHQNRDYFEVGKHFGSEGVGDIIPGLPNLDDYFLRTSYLVSMVYFKLTYDPTRVVEAINRRAAGTDVTIESSIRTTRIFSSWAKEYGYDFYYFLQPSIYSTRKQLTSNEETIRRSDEEFGKFHSLGYSRLRDRLLLWRGNFVEADFAIANEKEDLFIDNVHFGDRGYTLLGESMAAKLIQTNLILKNNCRVVN